MEQKNWTHVRHLFGYRRLGKFGIDNLMNDLYRNEWRLYQNFFMPTMKLIEKIRIGSRYRKKYDSPKTPYQRIFDEICIAAQTKEKLKSIYETLDPFLLKKSIQVKLKRIFQRAK